MRIPVLSRLPVALPLCLAAATILSAGPAGQASALLRQGNKFFENGRFTDAVAAYTGAIREDPEYPKAFYNRALANEMVDREQALNDWRHFLALVGTDPQWKPEVTNVQGRLEVLQKKPPLPATLRPAEYLARAGDYYEDVAEASEGLQWTHFPVAVFVGSPPKAWQRAAQRALDEWNQLIPLRVTGGGTERRHCLDLGQAAESVGL